MCNFIRFMRKIHLLFQKETLVLARLHKNGLFTACFLSLRIELRRPTFNLNFETEFILN